jgi:hypothetical protein
MAILAKHQHADLLRQVVPRQFRAITNANLRLGSIFAWDS